MGLKRTAIIIPWFAKDLKGGAEQVAWQVATRLEKRGHKIEVLTTCCRAFQEDWATNHYKPGLSQQHGVAIRRFLVDSRDEVAFDRVNAQMLNLPAFTLKPGVSPLSPSDSSIFAKENINSIGLLNYLQSQNKAYDAFIFIPYLYGPILNGLPIVADRAYLQPCLHDEAYAYLPGCERIFRVAKGLLFNSESEAELAVRLYGPGVIRRSEVVGSGVEVHPDSVTASPDRIGSFRAKEERFILYLGRIDSTKNIDLLIRAFLRFKQEYPDSSLKLVLAGPGNASLSNPSNGLISLGLVQEKEKEVLLTHCLALFQPSRNESYSRTIMEAWLYGHPVAAHRDCLATATAVESARGGWLAGAESEWTELFASIDRMPVEELTTYGANGKCYATENATWRKVIDRYEEVLGLCKDPAESKTRRRKELGEVHQLLPNLAYGDAISNHALAIRDRLRTLGYRSNIFVRYLDPRVADEGKVFEPGCIAAEAGLFYHHSIGSELTEYAVGHLGPKCLIYHNITPAEFFEPFRPEFARILAKGRAELCQLARHFNLSVGDSAYNASELEENGFNEPTVLPLVVEPNRWNIGADPDLMRHLQDDKANLLFVGRIAPNKKQDQLLEAFADYLVMDRDARLILVGHAEADDPYYRRVVETVEKLGLTNHVVLAGMATDNQLLAYYRAAHLFWSMSEHEGFCSPIVEAMWFDIPVLAYKSTAIPETLGEAAIMFTRKNDLPPIAALAKHLVRDSSSRAKVLKAQRKRRVDFLPEIVWEKLDALLDEMEYPTVKLRPTQKRPLKKVAFVVQRCGPEVNGGAEALCLKIAKRMSAHWETEILTTCALDYMTWENYYPAGTDDNEGVRIRRFWVDRPRDVEAFNKLSDHLHGSMKQASLAEQEDWMQAQGPLSSDLIRYVNENKDEYEAFIFFSYLYATTYSVLPLVEEKAYLVPLAHDEWPIYLSIWDRFFKRPRRMIFNTPEERNFLRSRFPALHIDGPVAGVATEPPQNYNAELLRRRYGLRDPFLLYIGRIDSSKGCEELFSYFSEYRHHETCLHKLVLLGKAAMPVPEHPDIVNLGFVDEQTKWDALAACDLLVMPSPYESLSMVLLEAWSMSRAVLVNGRCEVLVGQCKRANGGLWYGCYDEFKAGLSLLLNNTDLRRRLAESGRRYATSSSYSWDQIENKYLDLLSDTKKKSF